jgi:hypothetical protein
MNFVLQRVSMIQTSVFIQFPFPPKQKEIAVNSTVFITTVSTYLHATGSIVLQYNNVGQI